MRIAIIGSRGIPARWGGYETVAEELATRLAARGHDVSVYCRSAYSDQRCLPAYRGVRLVYLPYLRGKFLETPSHELASAVHSLLQPFDIFFVLGCRTSWCYLAHRIFRRRVVFQTDGLDWERRKWGFLAKTYLKLSYWIAVRLGAGLVSDSEAVATRFLEAYGRRPHYLSYGANLVQSAESTVLRGYSLAPHDYFLVVCRLEPENNADLVIRAFEHVNTQKRLVIVGGVNYHSKFVQGLHRTQDSRVLFLGPVYKPGHLDALYYHSYAYIHGHEVGGTNPALLRAMGAACCVLALDVPFNVEVVGNAGLMWKKSADYLAERMRYVLENPGAAAIYRGLAAQRVKEIYDWERIVADHEEYFTRLQGDLLERKKRIEEI